MENLFAWFKATFLLGVMGMVGEANLSASTASHEAESRMGQLPQWLREQTIQRQAQAGSAGGAGLCVRSERQRQALDRLAERVGGKVEARFRMPHGTPLLIKGAGLASPSKGVTKAGGDLQAMTAQQFLRSIRDLLRIADPDSELELVRHERDELGWHHLRYEQHYQGLPVWPCEVVVHLDASGQVCRVIGSHIPTPEGLVRTPAIPVVMAHQAALHKLGLAGGRFSEARLIIYGSLEQSQPRLAWEFELSVDEFQSWHCIVDAVAGQELATIKRAHPEAVTATSLDGNGVERSINVWRDGSSYYLVDSSKPMFDSTSQMPHYGRGVIAVYDGGSQEAIDSTFAVGLVRSLSPASGWDPDAVGAAYGLSTAFDYYQERFGRNSMDGQGGAIRAIVRYGEKVTNAFWLGAARVMAFGYGYTRQIEGCGHEFTHGVLNSLGNGGILEFRNQPGALNEALADIFGEMVEAYSKGAGPDWLKVDPLDPANRSKLRQDYAQPGLVSQVEGRPNPDRMSQFVVLPEDQDNGGVHVNSSIISHCFYLLAEGLEGALGLGDAEQIFYRAMTVHLLKQSQFVDMRHACVSAAEELFGPGSVQAAKTKEAFDAVEIADAPNSPPNTPIPAINSPDSLLALRYDPLGDGFMLVRRETAMGDGSDGTILDTVDYVAPQRPSVSGNGAFCVFITSDHDIAFINTDGTGFSRGGMAGLVHSVAMAPDGRRYAIVPNNAKTGLPTNEIWLVEIDSPSLRRIQLSAPGSEEARLNIIKYADSLDFMNDSRTVVFSAYSELNVTQGLAMSGWSLFRLDTANDSVGTVLDLSEGKSFGSPSLGQTQDELLTCEEIDKSTGTSTVVALNLWSGDKQIIAQAQAATATAFPTFSGDDLAILYTRGDAAADTGYSLFRINLANDHVTPQGQPTLWLQDAMMGVIYRRGAFSSSNALPTVQLIKPLPSQVFASPAAVVLEAEANDSDGRIARVEFYEGSTRLGETASFPYVFNLNDLTNRTYRFVARAVDDVGGVADSKPIEVEVVAIPRLAVSRLGSRLRLTWTASATGFVLQSCNRLGSTAGWTDRPEIPVVSGDKFLVLVPFQGSAQYYRLAKP